MSRRKLILVYVFIIFMMVWGFDLLAAIKYNQPILLADVFSLLNLSTIIYSTATLLLVRWVCLKWYLTRQYVSLVIGLIGTFIFFIIFRYTIEEVVYPLLFDIRNYRKDVTLWFYTLDNVYYGIVYVMLGLFAFLLENQVNQQKKQVLLQEQNREAELQFLRSQINPHFLFNTLNNIYSLVYEKSDKAPQAVLKLAELTRYMLYEKKNLVSLSKEWNYLQDFIMLQQLRFDHPLPIQVTVEGNIDNVEIAPYLLIPFAENAFKHGDMKKDSSFFVFRLVITGKDIFFEAENKIGTQIKEVAGGIGLNNVRKRLELLYPNRHSLTTETANTVFKVHLRIRQ